MKRKFWPLAIAILVGLTAGMTYFGIIRPKQVAQPKTETLVSQSDVTIAVVNEDQGYRYNGQNVRLADLLLANLAQTNQYRLETVPRSTANAGLDSGKYQVVLVMPSNFSKDSLNLESATPNQAVFQYRIKSDQQVLLKQAEEAVSNIKNAFNKDIINIYFSSIVGNLQVAQAQVTDVVQNQATTLAKYRNSLVDPLNAYSKSFTDISNVSAGTVTTMDNLGGVLTGTNEAFTSIIDTKKDYSGDVESVINSQSAWSQAMAQRELALGNFYTNLRAVDVSSALNGLNVMNTQTFPSLVAAQPIDDAVNGLTALNERLEGFESEISSNNEEVTKYLDETYRERIKEAVKDSMAKTVSETPNDQLTLGMLVTSLREKMNAAVAGFVSQMTIYSDDAINRMTISDQDKFFMKNVNQFINLVAPGVGRVSNTTWQASRLSEIKNAVQGQEVTLDVDLGRIEGTIRDVQIDLTGDNFELVSATINGMGLAVNGNVATGQQLNVAASTAVARATVRVKQVSDENLVNLFAPGTVRAYVITQEALEVTEHQNVVAPAPAPASPTPDAGSENGANNAAPAAPAPAGQPNAPTVEEHVSTTEKQIYRTYSNASGVSAVQFISSMDTAQAAVADMQQYAALAGIASAYYGLSLSTDPVGSSLNPSPQSLYAALSMEQLSDILVQTVADTISQDLKEQLVIPKAWSENAKKLKEEAKKLEDALQSIRTTTGQLNGEVGNLISLAQGVHDQIANVPALEVTEMPDNANMTTVTMGINSDLLKLMGASQTLMANTTANQAALDSVKSGLGQLNTSVTTLETEGKQLTEKVTTLGDSLDTEYNNNKTFLDQFSQVMANTKTGNRKNQLVYDYLSNPVNADNVDTTLQESRAPQTQKVDTRSSLIFLMITFIMSLVLAQFLRDLDWTRLNFFKATERQHLRNSLVPVTAIALSGGLLGTLIAIIGSSRLNLAGNQGIALGIILALMGMGFVLVSHGILLRLKSFGLLVLVGLLMAYVISASQLFDGEFDNLNTFIRGWNPLTYMDQLLTAILNFQTHWLHLVLVPLAALFLGLAINSHYYRKLR